MHSRPSRRIHCILVMIAILLEVSMLFQLISSGTLIANFMFLIGINIKKPINILPALDNYALDNYGDGSLIFLFSNVSGPWNILH